MELMEGIESRKSIRAFKAVPITRETLVRILEVARKSPSYTNTQPWEVVVVSGKKKDALSSILYNLAESETQTNPDVPTPQEWPSELDKRAKEHSINRFQTLGIERENIQQRKEFRLLNFKFYGAPSVIFLFIDRTLTSWSLFDAGLFSQSLVLAAHSLGLGKCLQASLTGYPDIVRNFLGIPKSKILLLGISIRSRC
jgi:nitroreductase